MGALFNASFHVNFRKLPCKREGFVIQDEFDKIVGIEKNEGPSVKICGSLFFDHGYFFHRNVFFEILAFCRQSVYFVDNFHSV